MSEKYQNRIEKRATKTADSYAKHIIAIKPSMQGSSFSLKKAW
jgi:hypothetical protein